MNSTAQKSAQNLQHNTKINSMHENYPIFETQHEICSTTKNVQHDMKIKARHKIDSTTQNLLL